MSVSSELSFQKKFSRIRDVHMEAYLEKYGNLLEWKPNETILDIGCGAGNLTYNYVYPLLPKDFSKLILSDISIDALMEAKKLFANESKVFFEELDIVAPVEEVFKQKFDHIFSAFCLMWINDQTKALENIYSLLAPGGGCFLVSVAKHAVPEIVVQLLKKPKWKRFVPDINEAYPFPYSKEMYPVKTVEKLMEDIGFVNVKVYLEKTSFAFYDDEEFLGFFESFPNPMQFMTAKEKEDYLKEALELAYTYKIIDKSGVSVENGSLFVIYGEK